MEAKERVPSEKSLKSRFMWRSHPQRPPWTNETLIREHCTGCGACIDKCPEVILVTGPAGTPALDFQAGGCTFCGLCADACPEDIFHSRDSEPWELVADIGRGCLMNAGIACRTCMDACDVDALLFDMRSGPAGRVHVTQDNCTGCGACMSICPIHAITLIDNPGTAHD